MHKQRIGILIVAVLGVFSGFLPWYKSSDLGSFSPVDTNIWTTFVLCSIPIILCLTGNSSTSLSKKKFYGAIAPSILAVLMGVFAIWQIKESNRYTAELNEDPFMETPLAEIEIEFGLYFWIILNIALPIVATKTRDNQPKEKDRTAVSPCSEP